MTLFGYQPSLQTKVISAFCLVGLLPLAFLTFRLISLNKDAFSEQVLRVNALASKTTSSQVDSYLEAQRGIVKAAADNPTIHLDPSSQNAQFLTADLLSSGNQELIAIVSMNDAQEELIRVQKKGRAALVNHLVSLGTPGTIQLKSYQGLPWLIISERFPEGGDIRFIASAKTLQGMLDPTELGEGAKMVLTDQTGLPLVSSDEAETIPSGLISLGTNGRISGSGEYDTAEGSKVLGSYSPTNSAPWVVMSWQPLEVAESVARRMQTHALQAVFLAIFITVLLSLIAYFSVVRPIRSILGSSSWRNNKGDEIKQLEHAFNALRNKEGSASRQLEDVFLGRYQVLEKVGEGGMGTVFQGFDPKLKRPIALKTLLLNTQSSKEETHQLVEKLLKEATTAANLNHANIVSVYDVKDADQYAYVAMEFVDGSSLSSYLKKHGPLPPKQAMALFADVAKGLAAAHEKSIVHRDIKPANILLGKDHSVKIADFGISQLLTSLENSKQSVAGTPGFLSPEVLRSQPFTEAADLFALGVTMYRALTGLYPFPGATVKSVLERTLKTNPRSPHEMDKNIPNALSDLIMRLLEKDPKERLTNINVLIYGLESLSNGQKWIYHQIPTPEEHTSILAPEELQYVATATNFLPSDSSS